MIARARTMCALAAITVGTLGSFAHSAPPAGSIGSPVTPSARPGVLPAAMVDDARRMPAAPRGTGNDALRSRRPWESLGKSAEGRSIEYAQFGKGARHVLLVGPLEGDWPHGLIAIDRLVEHLARFPRRLVDSTVTVVRDPNPDGRLHRTLGNAHGIELNRNFSSTDWRKIPAGGRWLSGRSPESEPETRLIAELIADLRPDRIVLLGASNSRDAVGYVGTDGASARAVSHLLGAKLLSAEATVMEGSLASYAGRDRGISTLVVAVSKSAIQENAWPTTRRALLEAIATIPEQSGAAPAAKIQDPPNTERGTVTTDIRPPAQATGTPAEESPSAGTMQTTEPPARGMVPVDEQTKSPAQPPREVTTPITVASSRSNRFAKTQIPPFQPTCLLPFTRAWRRERALWEASLVKAQAPHAAHATSVGAKEEDDALDSDETVPVVTPRAARRRAMLQDKTSPRAAPSAGTWDERVRPLPPINAPGASQDEDSTNSSLKTRLPQEPIPFYPETDTPD